MTNVRWLWYIVFSLCMMVFSVALGSLMMINFHDQSNLLVGIVIWIFQMAATLSTGVSRVDERIVIFVTLGIMALAMWTVGSLLTITSGWHQLAIFLSVLVIAIFVIIRVATQCEELTQEIRLLLGKN